MIYGYARCSTNESKQDINRQIRELKQLGASDETMYFEYGSGTKRDRVEFNKLLKEVKPGDTIVTTEVSRLSRSTQHLCEIIDIIKNKQLKLIIGNTMTIDCTAGELDPMTKAFLQMSGVFAELERNNAKAKGKTLGRPTTKGEDVPSKFIKNYKLYLDPNNNINVTELARMCNMSRTTVYKYMKLMEK